MTSDLRLTVSWTMYKFPVSSVLVVILCSLFMIQSHVVETEAAVGEDCSRCTPPTESCSADQRCECSSGYSQDTDGVCRKNKGESCTATQDCRDTLTCVTPDNICTCVRYQYFDSIEKRCKPAANEVTAITPTSRRDSATNRINLEVTWTPGEYTGYVRHGVLVEEETSLNSGNFTAAYPTFVEGYNTTTYTMNNVLAFWNYRVSVMAMTHIGASRWVGPELIRTATNYPGIAQNFSVKQDDKEAQEMTITVACPEEKSRNGTITGYRIRKTSFNPDGGQVDEEYNVTAVSPSCTDVYSASDVGRIAVGKNYAFQIRVVNNDFTSSYSEIKYLFVEPKAPRPEITQEIYGVKALVSQDSSKSQQTAINVTVCAPCLLDARQGRVEKVGLIVCKTGNNSQCGGQGRRNTSSVNFDDFPTWRQAKKSNFTEGYRATPDDWMQDLYAQNPSYRFIIGIDKNCTDPSERTYCNGPLPAGSDFRISVIKCNVVECVLEENDSVFITKAEKYDITHNYKYFTATLRIFEKLFQMTIRERLTLD